MATFWSCLSWSHRVCWIGLQGGGGQGTQERLECTGWYRKGRGVGSPCAQAQRTAPVLTRDEELEEEKGSSQETRICSSGSQVTTSCLVAGPRLRAGARSVSSFCRCGQVMPAECTGLPRCWWSEQGTTIPPPWCCGQQHIQFVERV